MSTVADKSDEARDVEAVIKGLMRAFADGDSDGILTAWHLDDDSVIHQPEEFGHPVVGAAALRYYYKSLVGLVHNFRDTRLDQMETRVYGDFAWSYMRGSATFDVVGLLEPLAGSVRQTFVLHKMHGQWKIVHYHESRETPGIREAFQSADPTLNDPDGRSHSTPS
jgi:ketosteroid isomerase-like protein